MTTASVAKTTTYHGNLADLKGIKYAIEDWVRRVRVSREASRIGAWNREHSAVLEARGARPFTSYFTREKGAYL
jgi:hypothetical protein